MTARAALRRADTVSGGTGVTLYVRVVPAGLLRLVALGATSANGLVPAAAVAVAVVDIGLLSRGAAGGMCAATCGCEAMAAICEGGI
jgi:hypothetical protein